MQGHSKYEHGPQWTNDVILPTQNHRGLSSLTYRPHCEPNNGHFSNDLSQVSNEAYPVTRVNLEGNCSSPILALKV